MGNTNKHKVCLPVAGRAAVVRLIDALPRRRRGPDHRRRRPSGGRRRRDNRLRSPARHLRLPARPPGHRARRPHRHRGALPPGLRRSRADHDGRQVVRARDDPQCPTALRRIGRRPHRREHSQGPEQFGGPIRPSPPPRHRRCRRTARHRAGPRAARLYAMAAKKDTLSRAALRRAGLQRIRPATKLWPGLGTLARFGHGGGTVRTFELAQAIREAGTSIRVGGQLLSPEQVERRSPTINQSVYIGEASASSGGPSPNRPGQCTGRVLRHRHRRDHRGHGRTAADRFPHEGNRISPPER